MMGGGHGGRLFSGQSSGFSIGRSERRCIHLLLPFVLTAVVSSHNQILGCMAFGSCL